MILYGFNPRRDKKYLVLIYLTFFLQLEDLAPFVQKLDSAIHRDKSLSTE